jgi:hypothetical protein
MLLAQQHRRADALVGAVGGIRMSVTTTSGRSLSTASRSEGRSPQETTPTHISRSAAAVALVPAEQQCDETLRGGRTQLDVDRAVAGHRF